VLPAIVPPDLIDGRVVFTNGQAAGDVLVYIMLQDGDGQGSPGYAAPMSTFVGQDVDGMWSAVRSDARTGDLQQTFISSEGGDKIDILVRAAIGVETSPIRGSTLPGFTRWVKASAALDRGLSGQV
jgi:hypothetical protein